MAQATTTREGFDTVSQSGSGATWLGLSNMPYPTEGEATVGIGSSPLVSNTISLRTPQKASGIPVGAMFDSASFQFETQKGGTFSPGQTLDWSYRFSIGSAFLTTQTNSFVYEWVVLSGDRSYLGISSAWSDTAIIDGLKDGTFGYNISVSTTSSFSLAALIRSATVTITYTTVEGKRGAALLTIL